MNVLRLFLIIIFLLTCKINQSFTLIVGDFPGNFIHVAVKGKINFKNTSEWAKGFLMNRGQKEEIKINHTTSFLSLSAIFCPEGNMEAEEINGKIPDNCKATLCIAYTDELNASDYVITLKMDEDGQLTIVKTPPTSDTEQTNI